MSGGQDWAAEVHRDMDNPVDTPNLAHRTSVLRRELAKERRATESAVELLRVVASEQISTSGGDMSDKKSCHSQVSDNELITVRWQDEQDGGWREGVVMCVVTNYCAVTSWSVIKRLTGGTSENTAIIYDRHRHERAIVTLSKVQIVEPRCD